MATQRETFCPRCGYDLSGAVASWEGSCPLEGVCPECGLNLDWGAVCNPDRYVPLWSFEHRLKKWIRAVPGALARTIKPNSFFERITIELRVVRRRLLLSLLLAAAILHAGVFAWSAAGAFFDQVLVPGRTAVWTPVPAGTTPPPNAQLVNGVYFVQAPVNMRGRYESWLKWCAALAVSPATPAWSAAITGVGMNWSVAAPRATLFCLTPVLTMPASMLLLPTTFARVKVKRVHLWRGLAYSCFWPCLIAAASMSLVAVLSVFGLTRPQFVPPWRGYLVEWSAALAAPIILAYLARFWYVFAHRYLRLPNAGLVVTLLMIVAILAPVSIPATAYYFWALSIGL